MNSPPTGTVGHTMTHTALPLTCDRWKIFSGDELIADCHGARTYTELLDRTSFIVKAVNAHDELVSALRAYKDDLCEGFCHDWPGEFSPDQSMDCQGCLARNTLLNAKVQS